MLILWFFFRLLHLHPAINMTPPQIRSIPRPPMIMYVREKADRINSIESVSVFCVGTAGGEGGVAWVVDDTEGRTEVCVGLGEGGVAWVVDDAEGSTGRMGLDVGVGTEGEVGVREAVELAVSQRDCVEFLIAVSETITCLKSDLRHCTDSLACSIWLFS